jgi:hypothetical protein
VGGWRISSGLLAKEATEIKRKNIAKRSFIVRSVYHAEPRQIQWKSAFAGKSPEKKGMAVDNHPPMELSG